KTTGKNLWKTERTSRGSWTSPVIGQLGDRTAVIVSSNGSLDAYDAASGKLLATFEGLVGNNIPSPTVYGDLVVVGAGENRINPDAAASAKSNCCLRLASEGAKTAFEKVWDGRKAICHVASPLIHEGHAYFVTRNGVVYCVDLMTGTERYSQRLDHPCWATPIAAGDRVYFFGKDGVTTVLKAGPKYECLASNRLWTTEDFAKRFEEAKKKVADSFPMPNKEGQKPSNPPLPKEERETMRYAAVGDVVYGVAAVDGTFLVRTGTELYCLRETRPAKNP
ncbi:MAG: PQQ-like beta-propeller repeat protein, partial [Gemmataceae bacterium]|nr:PQQ-like beta-propeller repeat protein [Gemmataceae bacterium]